MATRLLVLLLMTSADDRDSNHDNGITKNVDDKSDSDTDDDYDNDENKVVVITEQGKPRSYGAE